MPGPIKLPPPKTKQQQTQQGVYRAYVNAHPALRRWASGIWQWARYYGVDPVYFASLINTESGGKPGAVSSAGAVGLGQIMPAHAGEPVPWNPSQNVTLANLKDPAFNLRWSAWYFGQKLQASGGNYDQAYRGQGGYNQGGPTIFQDVPKGYVPIGATASPQQTAERSVETGQAKQDLTDPFVTIKNGRLVNAKTEKQAVHYFGQPLRRSEILNYWQKLNDLWLQYTGHGLRDPKMVENLLRKGWSDYQIIDYLSKQKGFVNSPAWKQNAGGYIAVWHSLYGNDAKPDKNAIRAALIHNVGGEAFADQLRKRGDYVNSNEFKTTEAGLGSVYTKIFGVPDENGRNTIKQAVLHGWSADQFAAYLRKQPQYTHSQEHISKVLYLASSLGMLTGDVPTLAAGMAQKNPNGPPTAGPGTDPRAGAIGPVSGTSNLNVQPGQA